MSSSFSKAKKFPAIFFQLSFLFMDGDENLLIDSVQTFAQQLGCDVKAEVTIARSRVHNPGESSSLLYIYRENLEDFWAWK